MTELPITPSAAEPSASPALPLARPFELRAALALLGVAMAIGWIHVFATLEKSVALIRETYAPVPELAEIPDSTWSGSLILMAACGFLVNLLIFWGLWLGKSWVRTVFTALTILGVLGFVFSALLSADLGPLSMALRSAQTALTVVALLYLRRPDTKAWFQRS